MVFAYHIIFTTHGFWLPNDPRGSWSHFVASWELLWYGAATKTSDPRSQARRRHDRALRAVQKTAMKYPPVVFNGEQARCVAEGIGRAVHEAGYVVHACSVMPDHVHLVIARHPRRVKQIVGHLKARATQVLNAQGLNPLGEYRVPDGRVPSPWVEGCWTVFLDSHADVLRAIEYVERNPLREGFKAQRWTFVVPYLRRE